MAVSTLNERVRIHGAGPGFVSLHLYAVANILDDKSFNNQYCYDISVSR